MLTLLPLNAVFANCDLSQFRWDCELPIQARPTAQAHSLVYCGNSYGYVSTAQFDMLERNLRANIQMVLKIDGEYLDSPCIPGHR